jgi:hypothetical protein
VSDPDASLTFYQRAFGRVAPLRGKRKTGAEVGLDEVSLSQEMPT